MILAFVFFFYIITNVLAVYLSQHKVDQFVHRQPNHACAPPLLVLNWSEHEMTFNIVICYVNLN